MSGHVFVVHGDLTHLACDDWLIPTDRELTLTEGWLPTLSAEAVVHGDGDVPRLALDPPAGWGTGEVRTVRLPDEARAPDEQPSSTTRGRAWLLDVGTDPDVGADWLVTGVRRWLDLAGQRPHGGERARPLLGLPLVGTGAGGAATRHDEVLRELLPALRDHARSTGVDVALVLNDVRDHAAAQDVRRALGFGWDLDDPLLDAADALAGLAGAGSLALFLGAGVSAAAGLPLWEDLIGELLDLADVRADERDAVRRLDVPDQAEYVARRLDGGGDALREWVCRRFGPRPHALAHTLLAALPVREAVTTNWDGLFEQAVADTGRGLAVLPYEPRADAIDWLLKLHGDAGHGSGIVVRRQDYLRFGADQSALAGVVQALLFTRHMLFVGFSLVDDNFVRIANDVTRLVDRYAGRRHEHGDRPRIGTTVALRHDPAKQTLWPHLDHLAVASTDMEIGERARRLELFLDALSARVDRSPAYLLDERYAGLLDGTERDLARLLGPLAEGAAKHGDSGAWARVARLLAGFGHTPT